VNIQKLTAGLVVAMGLSAIAGGANATQYLLNVDKCSTPGCIVGANDGTINVTSIVGGLHIDIQLATDIFFNQAGKGHQAFGTLLTGNPDVTFDNFSDKNLGGAVESPTADFGLAGDPPPFEETGTGDYNGMNYGFLWISTPTNNGHLTPTDGIKALSFDIFGSGLSVGHDGGTPPLYFTVDVARINADNVVVATGVVGATLDPGRGVPEPATWALMIAGFGGVGAMLRRRQALNIA